jgi:hypothetical protein
VTYHASYAYYLGLAQAMSVLDTARKVYDRLKARRNGHAPPPAGPQVVSVGSVETPPPAECDGWVLVRDRADLPAVLQAVDESAQVGLDVETVGLDPRRGRVRLLSLATDRGVWLLDLFALGDLTPLWGPLAEAEVVAHNATFDLAFLWRLGFRPGRVCDLLVLSRLLTAGTRQGNALADLAARELGLTLDKARRRKERWEERYAAPFHTVAFDDRKGRKFSGHRLYYRRGVGSVRLSAMEKMADFGELLGKLGG